MNSVKILYLAIFSLFILVGSMAFISPVYSDFSVQYLPPSLGISTPSSLSFNSEMCQDNGQEFIIQIDSTLCEPAIVRADLLKNQDVPVLCPIIATEFNPLININLISHVDASLSSNSPNIRSVSFYPNKVALLDSTNNVNPSFLNSLGYALIVVKKQNNYSQIPEFVGGNITIRINYDVSKEWGTGNAKYYLPELTKEQFYSQYSKYSFWDGRGYLKVDSIELDRAIVSIYSSPQNIQSFSGQKLNTVTLEKGKTSNNIYLPGLGLCLASLKLRLNNLEVPDTNARIDVNGNAFQLIKGESFLDNRCTISNINKKGIYESVQIRCYDDNRERKDFDFVISPKIDISINESTKSYSLGDKLYQDGKKNVYLGFIGTIDGSQYEDKLYARFLAVPTGEKTLSQSDLEFISDFDSYFTSSDLGLGVLEFSSNVVRTGYGAMVGILSFFRGKQISGSLFGSEKDIFNSHVEIKGFSEPSDVEISNATLKLYYDKANKDFGTVIENYLLEKSKGNLSKELGELALKEKILLASSIKQNKEVISLCKEYEQFYPKKILPAICSKTIKLSSTHSDSNSIVLNGQSYKFSFEGIYEPIFNDYGATIRVVNNSGTSFEYKLKKDQVVYLPGSGDDLAKKYYFKLTKIQDNDVAEVEIYVPQLTDLDTVQQLFGKTKKLEKNKPIIEGYYTFTLIDTNLRKYASISIISETNNLRDETKVAFKLGIDKGNVLLSKDMVKKQIQAINKTIEKTESILKYSDKIVRYTKAGCFATGVGLNVYNLISNAGGKGLARQVLMRSTGGWYDRCNTMVDENKFTSVQQCLYKKSGEINKEVDILTGILKKNNKIIKDIQDASTDKVYGFMSYTKKLNHDNFSKELSKKAGKELKDFIESANSEKTKDINIILQALRNNNPSITTVQKRDGILLNLAILNNLNSTDGMKKIANNLLNSSVSSIKQNVGRQVQLSNFARDNNIDHSQIIGFTSQEKVKQMSYTGSTVDSLRLTDKLEDINRNTPVQVAFEAITGKEYIFVLQQNPTGYSIQENDEGQKLIYDFDGRLIEKPGDSVNKMVFIKYEPSLYENKFSNPEIKYYESGILKGTPAIVPFDLNNGWYIGTRASTPLSGNLKSVDDSGSLKMFYLCNVGVNKVQDFFSESGDDICQGIDIGAYSTYSSFYGLSPDIIPGLVGKSIKAFTQAQKAYKAGVRVVDILDEKNVEVGKPAIDIPDIQCEDFMSPRQCQILANICDPVLCPTSRCDFGGKYPVEDVAQTGIAGSLLLCLPNAQEGIFVPICLTGVNAGLQNWLSVEKSYQECLQHNLATGENIGICEEIYTFYSCDFFYRQAQPLIKLAIPNLIDWASGGRFRGGGEYLFFSDTWKKSQDNLKQFIDYYMANTKSSFKFDSISQLTGDYFCKQYVSASVPTGGKLFKELTNPDSPPQFTGRLEEFPHTTVTSPPLSRYKVFYHIYAGENNPAYFKVYLAPKQGSSFYRDVSLVRAIDSGYLAQGEYKTETTNFIAPSGYDQLCININGQEECGFQLVSSSLGFDYLQDVYIKNLINNTEIKTEAECKSGKLLGISPEKISSNLDLSNLGVTRICATNPPDGIVNANADTENSRWVSVGTCGASNIKCWLDTQSVKAILDSPDIANYLKNLAQMSNFSDLASRTGDTSLIEDFALDYVNQNYINILKESNEYLSEDEFEALYKKLTAEKSKMDDKKIIENITDVLDKLFFINQKANLYYIRGQAYANLAEKLFGELSKQEKQEVQEEQEAPSFTSSVFEFQDGTTARNLYYKFDKGKWQVGSTLYNWQDVPTIPKRILKEDSNGNQIKESIGILDKDKKFIKSLEDKSYRDGLKLLINRTLADDEGGWFFSSPSLVDVDNEITMNDKGVFKFSDAQLYAPPTTSENSRDNAFYLDLYLKYDAGSWKWSFDGSNWLATNIKIIQGNGYSQEKVTLDAKYHPLLNNLQNAKNFYQGTEVIFNGLKSPDSFEDRRNIVYDFKDPKDYTLEEMKEIVSISSKSTFVGHSCSCGFSCDDYANLILEASKNYGIPDPVLLLSLMMQESDCSYDVGSSVGAVGLMQISDWELCKEELNLNSKEDILGASNIPKNIECGAIILKKKYGAFKNGEVFQGCNNINKKYYNWEAAIRGYNGWGCLTGSESQDYFVENIFDRFIKVLTQQDTSPQDSDSTETTHDSADSTDNFDPQDTSSASPNSTNTESEGEQGNSDQPQENSALTPWETIFSYLEDDNITTSYSELTDEKKIALLRNILGKIKSIGNEEARIKIYYHSSTNMSKFIDLLKEKNVLEDGEFDNIIGWDLGWWHPGQENLEYVYKLLSYKLQLNLNTPGQAALGGLE